MSNYRSRALLSTCALLSLAACGGGSQGGVSAPVAVVSGSEAVVPVSAPTPAPTPTPTPAPALGPQATVQLPASTESRKVLADQVFYTRGSYSSYAGPWCSFLTPKLIVGRDLIDSISLLPSTFPNDVVISTSAPLADPTSYGCGVYGYHHVAYGNYDGGVPQVPVRPRQVDDIASLVSEVEVSSQSASGQYNVLHEFYLTSAAGQSDAKLLEIGYFLHPSASAMAFAQTGTSLGSYTDSDGRKWTISKVDKFVMLLPADRKDVGSARLDIRVLLTYLKSQRVLNGSEWFNGIAVGIEPVKGDSTLTVRRWNVALS